MRCTRTHRAFGFANVTEVTGYACVNPQMLSARCVLLKHRQRETTASVTENCCKPTILLDVHSKRRTSSTTTKQPQHDSVETSLPLTGVRAKFGISCQTA